MQEKMRLSKLMALRGMCSRREAEHFIERSQVLVDGQIISRQGVKVSVDAKIELLKQAKSEKKQKVTILLHKPLGVESCYSKQDYIPAIDLITEENKIKSQKNMRFSSDHKKKLAISGRLDVDSTGLLVLTQDGTIAKKLIGENSKIEKEYIVKVEGKITEKKIKKLAFGLMLDGKPLKRARVIKKGNKQLIIILKEGKNRQIRRMCQMVGLKVVSLKRTRIGKISLNNLPYGRWRYLLKNENF